MQKVDRNIRKKVKELGAFDMEACYSCGNCSAICPLSEGDVSFPRKMIRYSLLGLQEKLVSSPEPWFCYYCGECSDTCPREADPGGLMMALRRFAIRKYSFGKIADLFYSSFASGAAWIFLTLVALMLIVFYYDRSMNLEEVEFLSFMSLEHIHNAGVTFGWFLSVALALNLTIMVRALTFRGRKKPKLKDLASSFIPVVREALLQRRTTKCEGDRKRYWAHMGVFWGFAGMFLATILVMGIDYEYLGISRSIPFILGSVFGVLTLVGTSYFIYLRAGRKGWPFKRSHPSDWIFLVLIVLSVSSGFVMDLFKVLEMPRAAYITFAFHLIAVFDLLVSLPFTKFAHMIYRPMALWLAGIR
ncbi:MAG: 4Fe-4S dicluster domain-containing protein [Bacteroidales bacterium]|nr:4Fe-4S dicluster domain-containing protein [Candidatus Latescibacterota bacterium]